MDLDVTNIENLIRKRRERESALAEDRRRALYTEFPELKDLDDQIRIGKAEALLSIVENCGAAADHREWLSLERDRVDLLKRLGIPEDYDAPRAVCDKCRDSGWLSSERCSCFFDLLYPLIARRGGLENNLDATFAMYTDAYYSHPEKMAALKKMGELYAAGFPGQQDSLLFLGKPGTGKTYLALCIANAVAQRGVPVYFGRISKILDVMDRYRVGNLSFSPDPEWLRALEEERNWILDADLLVIDEMGVEARGMNTVSDILEILSTRRMKNLATIITSNLLPEDLQKVYSNRIYSRLFGDFQVKVFPGEDLRLHPKYRNRA